MSSAQPSPDTNDDSTNGSESASSDLAAFADSLHQYVRTMRVAVAALAGLLILTLGSVVVLAWSLLSMASDTNDIVSTLDEATGPRAQRTAQRTVQNLVIEIDCRSADRLQRTIDVLVERGVLEPGDLTVIDDACRRHLEENP